MKESFRFRDATEPFPCFSTEEFTTNQQEATKMSTLLYILCGIIAYILYNHFVRELREIDPGLLKIQTSVSETRQLCESSVYRSIDVPHGVSVTRGLSLQSGYKIRDGCLKDIWYLGLTNRKHDLHQKKIVLGEKSYDIGEVNAIIHAVATRLREISDASTIAIFGDLMENPELLFVVWSCFFISDKKLVFYNNKDEFGFKHENPIPTIVSADSCVDFIPNGLFENVVNIALPSTTKGCSNAFTDVIAIPDVVENSLVYNYDPDVDFAHVKNQLYSEIINGNEVKYYQLNFVSAVASKLMSIPSSQSWGDNDSLLISYSNQKFTNNNIIFGTCCGILSTIDSIKLIGPKNLSNLSSLAKYSPTILCTDSHLLKRICSNNRKTFWQSFKLQRSEYFNSLGYFNSFGKIEKRLNLKVAYICQLTPASSSFICNFCKSVLGCRIVREVYTTFSIGPILKTNLYDYRIIQNNSMPLLGVPANSVELKTINSTENAKNGKLYVRGMSVGKGEGLETTGEFWIYTGIVGAFGKDCCFYGNL